VATKVDTLLAWLSLPAAERPHLLTTYIGDVDAAGHRFGPDAPAVRAAALRADSALGRLLDGLAAHPLRDSTYVVVVSDHGMAAVDHAGYQALAVLIDTAEIRAGFTGTGALASLFVAGGDAGRARALSDTLNQVLRHGRAYLRRDVPERLHYRADPRAGDVVVVMEQPYLVGMLPAPRGDLGGTHGWDPASPAMHGILLVSGPRARRGVTIPPVESVDVYPLLVELLGLRSAPSVDGRPGRLRALVVSP
jgi:predicted AlkP superfamily pyrophosphatase or phosphodiesterase